MSFRRAFSTLGCPDFTLDEVLALAVAHQFDAIELRALAGTLDLPAHLMATFGTPAALAAKLNKQRVRVAAIDTSLRLADNTPADRDAFLAFVPWAEALDVPHLRVFEGGEKAGEAELGRMAATLKWWRELKTQRGWRTDVMVETHDSLFTTDDIARLLAVAPGTAILWDSHHTWKMGREDPLLTWEKLRAHIVHVHIKDSISRPDGKNPYTYVPPGEGEFPAKPLLAELRKSFTGTVSLEWERYWHSALPPLTTALDAAHKNSWWT